MVSAYMLLVALSVALHCLLLSVAASSVDYSCLHSNNWLVNTAGMKNSYLGSLTELQSMVYSSTYATFTAQTGGIPSYSHIFTASDVSSLNSRPHAAYDFTEGKTTVSSGNQLELGASIGYGCSTANGCYSKQTTVCQLSWWPPGPACPSFFTVTWPFTLNPKKETNTAGCYLGAGAQGVFVNGVAFYGYTDGLSYNNALVWNNVAVSLEAYDLDICAGHAAGVQYHHHSFSRCLAERLGDTGMAHSPIYGWSLDGFPQYGPWQSAGVVAQSCWKKRNYNGNSTASGGWGCGSAGKRTCTLDNEFSPKGVFTISPLKNGPDTSSIVTSQSGNTFTAVSGTYYEDYYFDTSCYKGLGTSADATLNVNNGHDHDGLGFHYHVTVTDSNSMAAAFPFGPGPQFYGCLSGTSYSKLCKDKTGKTATSTCSTISYASTTYKCKNSTYGVQEVAQDASPMGPDPVIIIVVVSVVVVAVVVSVAVYLFCRGDKIAIVELPPHSRRKSRESISKESTLDSVVGTPPQRKVSEYIDNPMTSSMRSSLTKSPGSNTFVTPPSGNLLAQQGRGLRGSVGRTSLEMSSPPKLNFMSVVVPSSSVPGDRLQLKTPTGKVILFTVPEGAAPGQTFRLQY